METIGASHSTRRREALFQRHHVLEGRGIFADAAAAGAGEVAGVQRFELQDHREFRRLAQFVFDDVAGDFFRQREGETHNYLSRATSVEIFRKRSRRIGRRRFRLHEMPRSRQEKIHGRNALAGIDAGAARAKKHERHRDGQPQKSPI